MIVHRIQSIASVLTREGRLYAAAELDAVIHEQKVLYEEFQQQKRENEKLRKFISTLYDQLDDWHQTESHKPPTKLSDADPSDYGGTDSNSID